MSATNMVYPRISITYCTQCKWMLRAAYFGQELLSTFGTSIGEIALIPVTGGVFQVHLTFKTGQDDEPATILIWDRKSEGGFPETKILKQKIRNHIEPEKNLGHSDTPSSKATTSSSSNHVAPRDIHVTSKQIPITLDTSVQDPLVQEALSAGATPIAENAFKFRPIPAPKAPLSLNTEVDEDVNDPLLSEAMSATMSPADRKQAEYAFMVATQEDHSNQWEQPPAAAEPRSLAGKDKDSEVVDEALERLKRDVAAATPASYKQKCEDCN